MTFAIFSCTIADEVFFTIADEVVVLSIFPASRGGMTTLLMTWITPLLAATSAAVTFAPANMTLLAALVMVTGNPLSTSTVCEAFRSAAMTFAPLITWFLRMSARSALLRSAALSIFNASRAAANASSFGANTVNGPAPFKASTRPAFLRASVKTVNVPALTAVSTMSALDAEEMQISSRAERQPKRNIVDYTARKRGVAMIL